MSSTAPAKGAVSRILPHHLIELMAAALELEALGEVRNRLVDLLQVPSKLFRVDVKTVPGRASQCRASLELTDAGRDLAAALGAGKVDRLAVEKALGHPDLSCVSAPGVDAESPEGSPAPSAAERGRQADHPFSLEQEARIREIAEDVRARIDDQVIRRIEGALKRGRLRG